MVIIRLMNFLYPQHHSSNTWHKIVQRISDLDKVRIELTATNKYATIYLPRLSRFVPANL